VPDFAMQRMRINEDGTEINWPPFALEEKDSVPSPLWPDFESKQPWVLDGTYDALGEPIT